MSTNVCDCCGGRHQSVISAMIQVLDEVLTARCPLESCNVTREAREILIGLRPEGRAGESGAAFKLRRLFDEHLAQYPEEQRERMVAAAMAVPVGAVAQRESAGLETRRSEVQPLPAPNPCGCPPRAWHRLGCTKMSTFTKEHEIECARCGEVRASCKCPEFGGFVDVGGLAPDFTGGVESAAYIKQRWSGDHRTLEAPDPPPLCYCPDACGVHPPSECRECGSTGRACKCSEGGNP